MQITKSQKRKIFGISSIFVCLLAMAPSLIQGDEWPGGSYGLPRPKSGCPSSMKNGWREGWRFHDMENDIKSTSSRSRVSSGSHMDVTFIGPGRDVNRTFCMKENTGIQTRLWPNGSYCIYKSKDVVCQKKMSEGFVDWDDEDSDNKNTYGGYLPDGSYGKNTQIRYCCQTGGHWYDSIELPVSHSFYLLTSNSTESPKCQMVKWAFSYLEYIVFDTEDIGNVEGQGGTHLFLDGRKLYYCYYEDCHRTMTGPSASFRSHKAAVTEMDRRSQYCSWLITVAETYIVSLSFKELTIPSCDDTFLRIYDGSNNTVPLLGTYCGSNASTEVVVSSSTNSLYIVSNSGSYARSPKNNLTFHAQYKAENLTGDEWPSGSYGLPRPKSGCPSSMKNGWREGWRFQDMENDIKSTSSRSRVSSGSHMDVTFIGPGRDVNRTFCMKENTGIQTRFWPNGSYCIYKSKDVVCPKNMSEGFVDWDDEDSDNKNTNGGYLPDGSYGKNTQIRYCCQTGGHWYDSIELAVSHSFYLLTSNSTDSPKCQMVKWAFSYLEYIVFDTQDIGNVERQGGTHLFLDARKLYYCYYEDCHRTMTGPSASFRSHKAAVTEMDPRSQYCSWLITVAETYIVSLNFKELTIPSCDDTFLRIYDGSNNTVPLLGTYCGSNASTEVVVSSFTNSLYIVSNSGSYARSPKNNLTFHAQYKAENLTENQPSKPISVDNNESSVSKTVATTSTISTTPVVEEKGTTDDSSRIIIIASVSVGGVVFLSIVLIVLLVKYKRRKRARKLSTPVNIPMAVATPQESLPIDEEPVYETVATVNREFFDDVATNANKSEDTSAEGLYIYEIPAQNETYEEPKISPENPDYTELDKNRLQGRNTTDDGTYEKLVKRDSDYVIPADERKESYEDIRMGRKLPGYEELDLSKREAEDYQKVVKT